MDKIHESIEQVQKSTLRSTKEALRNIYDIIEGVSIETLISISEENVTGPSKYLIQLFISMSHVYREEYEEAFEVSMRNISEIAQEQTRILDSILAGLWTAARISASILKKDIMTNYLLGLAEAKEYHNTETITVIINSILMDLQKKEMYDEAYTFLQGSNLPEEADVGQASVFYYLASVVYLMAETYKEAEIAIKKAIVKSTDTLFTEECRKVHVVISLHLGKHPTREFFQANPKLSNYQKVLQAIKSCSLDKFHSTVSEIEEALKADGLYYPVSRLETAVQKEQIRRIGVVYTKIALESVGKMLGVSEESASFLLQKAISEGAIAGIIDPEIKEYIGFEKDKRKKDSLKIEEMLSVANSLAMIKKHEPVKKKTLEEMQADIMQNEYRI